MNIFIFSLIIAFHGIVLSALLLRVKFEETRPYLWLTILLLLYSTMILVSPDAGIISEELVAESETIIFYLIGPVLFAFVRFITGAPLSKRILLLLFSPAIVITLLFILSYTPFLYNSESGNYFIELLYTWNWIGSTQLELTCILLSFYAISESSKRAEEVSAGDELQLSSRLNLFLGVYTIIFVLDLLIDFTTLFIEMSSHVYSFSGQILSALWFAFIAYLMISDSDRYKRFRQSATPRQKYQRSGMSDDDVENLYLKAEDFMKSEEFYNRPDCTMPQLAEKLKVTTHELSQAINSGSGGNFSQFVNRFRVNRAKELLKDKSSKNLNVLQIALEAGFYSKATFNRVFREITGQTPTAFRKAQA